MSFRLDIQNLFLLISVLANAYLLLVVYFNGTENHARKFFMGLILGVIGWAFGMFMYRGADTEASIFFWTKVIYLSSGLLPLFLLLFAQAFPRIDSASGKKSLRYIFLFGILFILLPLADKNFVLKAIVNPQAENEILFNRSVYIWGTYIVAYLTAAFVILIKKYYASAGIAKQQLKYIIWGCILPAILGVTLNLVLLSAVGMTKFTWFGQFSTIIMTASITYAITNYRLMGTKFFIRRSLVILSAVFSILLLWSILYKLLKSFQFDFLMLNVLFIALTPFLYVWLKKFFYETANKHLFASLYDVHLLIKEISEKLWGAYSVREIGEELRSIFKEVFHAENIAILEIGTDGSLSALFNSGFDLPGEELSRGANLPGLFSAKKKEPIVVEEFVARNYLSLKREAAVDWLQAAKPAVLAPLFTGGAVSGFLLVGEKLSGDVFSREDFQVIREAAGSASLAIGIAKRYEEREREMRQAKELVKSFGNNKS